MTIKLMKNKGSLRDNPWKVSTIALAIFGIVIISFGIYNHFNNGDLEEKVICSSITATPAWVNSDGIIMGYGVLNNSQEEMISLIDLFINEKIRFVYNPSCSACQKQIELFGDGWKKIQENNLDLNCNEVLN